MTTPTSNDRITSVILKLNGDIVKQYYSAKSLSETQKHRYCDENGVLYLVEKAVDNTIKIAFSTPENWHNLHSKYIAANDTFQTNENTSSNYTTDACKSRWYWRQTSSCKVCGKEIAKSAKNCPYCGAKIWRNSNMWLVLSISIFILALYSVFNADYEKQDYISLSEFNQLETGMTYTECVEIIGIEGKQVLEVEAYDVSAINYVWSGERQGSSATLTFQDNKLVSKMSFFLK